MQTFRFGVNVGPSRSRADWVEKARKLEDLGYGWRRRASWRTSAMRR
jgi:hypothetical protein